MTAVAISDGWTVVRAATWHGRTALVEPPRELPLEILDDIVRLSGWRKVGTRLVETCKRYQNVDWWLQEGAPLRYLRVFNCRPSLANLLTPPLMRRRARRPRSFLNLAIREYRLHSTRRRTCSLQRCRGRAAVRCGHAWFTRGPIRASSASSSCIGPISAHCSAFRVLGSRRSSPPLAPTRLKALNWSVMDLQILRLGVGASSR